jgi:ribosomal protein S26
MSIVCDACGKEIPDEVIKARHYSQSQIPQHSFHDRQCATAWRIETGFYKAMSLAGRAARSAAVTKSNSERPRRRRRREAPAFDDIPLKKLQYDDIPW